MLLCSSVPEFEATKYLITNGEFLEFVKDNGYQRRELWTDEGKHFSLQIRLVIETRPAELGVKSLQL